MVVHETIVGRIREDLLKFGKEGTGYLGKHIVGSGEEAHLTTKVLIDLLKPHVILIAGKRGSGKSYSAGVIIEEFLMLKDEYRKKASFIIIDPMGIYWSMKYPNTQQEELLKKWNLEPRKFDVRVFVPHLLKEAYEKAGIPIDGLISIAPNEVTVEEWLQTFGLKRTEEIAIAFEKAYNEVSSKIKNFSLDDLINFVKSDETLRKEVRDALVNILSVTKEWGIFSEKALAIEELVKGGEVTILDVSRMKSIEVRNLLVALLVKKIYYYRVLSRKEEEKAKIENREPRFSFPLTWVVLEEAHNFIPSSEKVVSTDPILTLAKQGREPGISLVCITQMPNKVHQEVLSQCDLVICFRLTSEDDINALHSVMQTYVREEIEKFLARLPRWHGAAIILDDNLEKIFTVNIRPRISWHAGGTAALA
ncbi:MAG: ATP-binding protein [Candidatus Aenigmatarchaeota archaeon]